MSAKTLFYLLTGIFCCFFSFGCNYFHSMSSQMDPERVQVDEHVAEFVGTDKNRVNPSFVAYTSSYNSLGLKASQAGGNVKERNKAYLNAGITVANIYCDDFFQKISVYKAHREFAQSEINATNGITSTVLALAKASNVAIGATSAGFSLINSTFSNYDIAFLVSPDLPTVQRMVDDAMLTLKIELLGDEKYYDTFSNAEDSLRRYTKLCDFNGVKRLVNESIAASKPTFNNITSTSVAVKKTIATEPKSSVRALRLQ